MSDREDRMRLREQLRKSDKAGHNFHNDPGEHRRRAINELWRKIPR